jgi:short-chain fatty acids transporter
LLRALSRPLVRVAERWIPDALFFAIALSLVVALMAFALTDVGPAELILGWGDGLAGLLAFMTQIALVLLLGYTLAHTPAVQRLLRRVADLPRSPRTAYGFVAFVAALAGLLSWGLGLIVGGVMAVEVARAARRRGTRLHYPLLVAAGYSGYVLWHMGYSGSGPLAAATPGGIYEDLPGGLVDVSRTTFAPWNLAAIVVGLVVVAGAMMLLAPKGDDRIVEAPSNLLDPGEAKRAGSRQGDDADPPTPADRLDTARAVPLTLGIALGLFLVTHFGTRGFALTLDIVNWSFLCIILLLVANIRHLMRLVSEGSSTVGGVLVQYPLYAGIIGMMTASGLVTVFSDFFVDIASPATLGLWGVPVRRPAQHVHPLWWGAVRRAGPDLRPVGRRARGGPVSHHHGDRLRRPVDQHGPAVLGGPAACRGGAQGARHPRVHDDHAPAQRRRLRRDAPARRRRLSHGSRRPRPPALGSRLGQGRLTSMFVCHCAVVRDRDVIESTVNGSRCVADVCRDTGAGQICGRCIPTLRQLVCQHCPVDVQPGGAQCSQSVPASSNSSTTLSPWS